MRANTGNIPSDRYCFDVAAIVLQGTIAQVEIIHRAGAVNRQRAAGGIQRPRDIVAQRAGVDRAGAFSRRGGLLRSSSPFRCF